MEHDGCRIAEFSRWTRLLLEHERSYLSQCLGFWDAFLTPVKKAGIMHDIADIDACLAATDEPLRVQAP
jgi:hypothetical protein